MYLTKDYYLKYIKNFKKDTKIIIDKLQNNVSRGVALWLRILTHVSEDPYSFEGTHMVTYSCL